MEIQGHRIAQTILKKNKAGGLTVLDYLNLRFNSKDFVMKTVWALAAWLSWLEYGPAHKKVAG